MNALDLYAKIEQYIDFEDEVFALHTTFKEIIQELNPRNLLDVGCGQGGFLKQLANLDIDTLGIDLSSKQIEICQQNNINAKVMDICELNQQFNCITAIFDVINYISKKDITNFFQCIYNSLDTDGYFIFDVNTLYGFEEVAQGVLTLEEEEQFIIIDAIFQDEILETKITLFEPNGKLFEKSQEIIKQFYHTQKFLTHKLQNCGLEVESVLNFKFYDVEEFDKQIFIVKKVGKN